MPPFRVTRALLILALMLSSSFFLVANFSIRRATHLTRVANLLSPEVPSHPAESVSELTNPVYRPLVRGKRSPLGRNDYESEDSPNSTLIAFIVLAVFVGIPCFLCYSRKYNLLQCCCDDDIENGKRKRLKRSKSGKSRRGKKRKHKSRSGRKRKGFSSEDSSEDLSEEEDSATDVSPNSSLGTEGDRKHRRDNRSKNGMRKKKSRREKDREKKKRDKKRKKKKSRPETDTPPLTSLETGDNESSLPSTLPTMLTTPSSTFHPETPTSRTMETPIRGLQPVQLPFQPQAQPPQMQTQVPLPPEQVQPKSVGSEYAYIVYRPDTNYVAVSRTLKNLVPPNTTVVYKVDETSNLSEADSVMKGIKTRGEDVFLPSTESLRQPASPKSGKSCRSIRSNYFVVNSDLLLKKQMEEQARRKSQVHRPEPPPPKTRSPVNGSMKTNDTLFVYSTRAQFAKLPGYAQPPVIATQASQSAPKILCNAAPVASRASGLHGKPAQVRFSSLPEQFQLDELSEPSDDSDIDENGDAEDLRDRKKRHRQMDRELRKKRASGGYEMGRRRASEANLMIGRRKSSNVLVDEEEDSESDDEDSDDRQRRNRATKKERKRRHSSAGERRKAAKDGKHRRHSSVKLAGSAKRKLRRRRTGR